MYVVTKDGLRVWSRGAWRKPSEILEIARLEAQWKLEVKK